METINFIETFFNYQIVYFFKDERIIFAGTTTLPLSDLLEDKREFITSDYLLESVVYQPLNNKDYGTKKTE